MSKVEELRESIVAMAIEPTARAEVTFNLDSLIAAAEAQGVRKERRRLKATRETKIEGDRWIHGVGYFLIPIKAFRASIASLLSLAPKEEK